MLSRSPIHFFGSRRIGEDKSPAQTCWRYGRGNVFIPNPDNTNEYQNAIANIDSILSEQKLETKHPGVVLQSTYTNHITIVDQAFLNKPDNKLDPSGRIIINGDGLFTVLDGIPLMNKSGDAHAIIFKSAAAVGIIVGAWKCLSENIINLMLTNFHNHNISNDEIYVHVGPGLGSGSFGIGKPPLDDLTKTFGGLLEVAVTPKPSKDDIKKYYFNVIALLTKHAQTFGFNLDLSQTADTFDKTAWKTLKALAEENNDPELVIQYYKNSMFFSARLYIRCDRLIRRICKRNNLSLPAQLAPIPESIDFEDIKKASQHKRYNETGRCLNFTRL